MARDLGPSRPRNSSEELYGRQKRTLNWVHQAHVPQAETGLEPSFIEKAQSYRRIELT
jgi:hypothetical protein